MYNFGGDPVTQLNLINKIKKFLMKLGSLLSAMCRHRSMKSSNVGGNISISTALAASQVFTDNVME